MLERANRLVAGSIKESLTKAKQCQFVITIGVLVVKVPAARTPGGSGTRACFRTWRCSRRERAGVELCPRHRCSCNGPMSHG